jgi:transcriptional regulator with XRE-family HTH domain
MNERHWSGADLAREASKLVPEGHRRGGKRHLIGRHLVSAYCRGENEPTSSNLSYIAGALGVPPEELLPSRTPKRPLKPHVQTITTIGGRTRFIADVELDTELAMKLVCLINAAVGPSLD